MPYAIFWMHLNSHHFFRPRQATHGLPLDPLGGQGLAQHAAQVEQALARFDLDRAAELLETLPARR